MAKKAGYVRRNNTSRVLSDKDWITILGALLHDRSVEGRQLANALMTRSKPGRHVRLLRLIHRDRPRLDEMKRAMKVSRRTVFRYLNSLEEYGTSLRIDEMSRYTLDRVPPTLQRLL